MSSTWYLGFKDTIYSCCVYFTCIRYSCHLSLMWEFSTLWTSLLRTLAILLSSWCLAGSWARLLTRCSLRINSLVDLEISGRSHLLDHIISSDMSKPDLTNHSSIDFYVLLPYIWISPGLLSLLSSFKERITMKKLHFHSILLSFIRENNSRFGVF